MSQEPYNKNDRSNLPRFNNRPTGDDNTLVRASFQHLLGLRHHICCSDRIPVVQSIFKQYSQNDPNEFKQMILRGDVENIPLFQTGIL
jgi:hypothetical protein